ncbi:MAG: hypothetical protein JXO22_05560 [Phycisphaerae bacterium]|nr:hypothetical protein [Phycisphaerae bacterium]
MVLLRKKSAPSPDHMVRVMMMMQLVQDYVIHIKHEYSPTGVSVNLVGCFAFSPQLARDRGYMSGAFADRRRFG